MEIAVLGGGNGCYAAAAHLSEGGHNVRFWRRDSKALAPVRDTGTIALTDWRGTRRVPIALVTDDLAAAVAGAAAVVIPLPCTSHDTLAPLLAPLWEDGKWCSCRGHLRQLDIRPGPVGCGNPARTAFAETGTLPYLARLQGPGEVRISVYATRLPTGVFPARDSDHALALLRQIYPVEPLTDALDGALMNAGPIIHPPLIMMNAGRSSISMPGIFTMKARSRRSAGSPTPSIANALPCVKPWVMGRRIFLSPIIMDDRREEWMYGNAAHERLTDSGDWREPVDLLSHRYMREDTVLGLSFLSSMARRRGLAMPLADGFLAMAAAITGARVQATPRCAEQLGLDRFDDAALTKVLRDGFGNA